MSFIYARGAALANRSLALAAPATKQTKRSSLLVLAQLTLMKKSSPSLTC